MLRDIPDLAPRLLIRSAELADALPVACVHVRSWQAGYRGLLPDSYLDALKPGERAVRYSFGDSDPSKPATLVAVVDGTIIGFATILPGELAGLYVDPTHWSRGIGYLLLSEAQARLAMRGCDSAVLWVLAGNTRAERFYLKHGWRAEGATRSQEIWGIVVQEARYTRRLP